MKSAPLANQLLTEDDPVPVELINRHSQSALLLLCEHAGNHVPASLGRLGLSQDQLDSHIGWDIGAAELARQIADQLQAPLILQHYSRLVIDCNRPTDSEQSIPALSGGVQIPVNQTITADEKLARQTEIFYPLDQALATELAGDKRKAVFSIHSFTKELQGEQRPWNAGFLSRTDQATATQLCEYVAGNTSDLNLAVNQPYQIEDDSDWFIPRYAERKQLAHCLIEVRNDQLREPTGIARWADLLSGAIRSVVESMEMENNA